MGTADIQGQLWGARARDWADIQEAQSRSLFAAVLQKVTVGSGMKLLDIGCGSGTLCHMAAHDGAMVSGFDASTALLAIARERCPQGEFEAGDMEALPYSDDTFDVVTAINSFFFAADPVQALSEARRVARVGAPVVIAVWGKPEDQDAAAVMRALTALLPPPPADAPPPLALHQPGVLEALAMQADLDPVDTTQIACVWEYMDEQTAVRGILAAGISARVIQHAGEEQARKAVVQAIAPFKAPSGRYLLHNTFHYLLANA